MEGYCRRNIKMSSFSPQGFWSRKRLVDGTVERGGSWYLVQCKVRQDERAEVNLVRQGYECLRPTIARESLRDGRRQIITESLFPGYLFIRIGSDDSWAPLRSTRGVLRVVSFGPVPLAVDPAVISYLRQRAVTLEPEPALAAGEAVRIVSGPFSELEAIFLHLDGDERAVLLLNFLQRQQKIRVPLSSVAKS